MDGDAFKASWPCSLREAHGEAARVQGGAQPEGTQACLPAVPLPEPRPERRPCKVDESVLFFVCLRVSSWLPLFLFHLYHSQARRSWECEYMGICPLYPCQYAFILLLNRKGQQPLSRACVTRNTARSTGSRAIRGSPARKPGRVMRSSRGASGARARNRASRATRLP